MDRKIIVTEDNSKTLLISSKKETYHSTNGAYSEAMHVFINAGLKKIGKKKSVKIFEMGFGTGLNALVTLDYSIENNLSISYTTVENYILSMDIVNKINHAQGIGKPHLSKEYAKLHEADWNKPIQLHPLFTFEKIEADITTINLEKNKYHLIFFDAFSPQVQPDLWSIALLEKMYSILEAGGILVTYCAQGQFKRNLKAVGFIVENIPGPKGKREMTRAIKPSV